MPRRKIITPELLREQLVKASLEVRKDIITPAQANSIANCIRGALYSFQIEDNAKDLESLKEYREQELELKTEDRVEIDKLISTVKAGLRGLGNDDTETGNDT